MTLNQIKYFCKLAELQHYGKAAQQLFIAQPTLSKSMAQLEAELEVTLFEHKGRNVVLTDAGKTFYKYVKPGLSQIRLARDVMKDYVGSRRLPVIGSVSPAISSVVVPIMNAYRSDIHGFPKVAMRVGTSEDLIEDLRNGECDLVYCTRIPDADDITFVRISEHPFIVVMREDDPLASFESITPEMLNGRIMCFTNARAYNEIIFGMLEHYGVEPVIHSYANDDAAMFGMVRAGAAIFITSDYPQAYSKGLAIKRLDQDVCMREIYLAYTERSLLDSFAKDLIDFSRTNGPAILENYQA